MLQNILRLLKIQKIIKVDATISASAMTHDHPDVPSHPNCTFIPKKLAMRVGGMSMRDTRVKTFMILF